MGTGQPRGERWVEVCDYQRLPSDRGVCALVEGRQVAIFRISPTDDLFAISNYDPFSEAFVLSRGIVGSRGDVLKVASPVYKQSFDLRTGQCLDDPNISVATYPVVRRGQKVAVRVPTVVRPDLGARQDVRIPVPPARRSSVSDARVPRAPARTVGTSVARAHTGPARGKPLEGRRIALAEVREAELLKHLLDEQGATTISYPLVRIADTPHGEPVDTFLRELVGGRLDALVFLTGEGVRRLIAFAERAGLGEAVVDVLRAVTIVTRGSKPARALRELRILPTLSAEQPTTEGVIEAMQARDWRGMRVGVQLCGQKPNARLLGFLASSGAHVHAVAPYVYAQASDDDRVVQLIRHMALGEIDAVAFTCSAQVERVFSVAMAHGVDDTLRRGLRRTQVAALGPVVAAALRERDCHVDIIPARSFFMRSLTREIVAALKPPSRRVLHEAEARRG